jgi:hypothetical protein
MSVDLSVVGFPNYHSTVLKDCGDTSILYTDSNCQVLGEELSLDYPTTFSCHNDANTDDYYDFEQFPNENNDSPFQSTGSFLNFCVQAVDPVTGVVKWEGKPHSDSTHKRNTNKHIFDTISRPPVVDFDNLHQTSISFLQTTRAREENEAYIWYGYGRRTWVMIGGVCAIVLFLALKKDNTIIIGPHFEELSGISTHSILEMESTRLA